MGQRCEYREWRQIEDCDGAECTYAPNVCATYDECPEPARVKIAWNGSLQSFCTSHAIRTVIEDPTWQVVAAE